MQPRPNKPDSPDSAVPPKSSSDVFGETEPADLQSTIEFRRDSSKAEGQASWSKPEQWLGQKIGRYTILEVLGIGGMGVVFKGHDPAIERDVAIKVLPKQLAHDPVAVGRFLTEAKSTGRLNHPNTVTVYEVGQVENTYFLALELVSGGSVQDYLTERGAYPVVEATRLMIQACQGLAAAHELDLIHRDIKPANLLLTQDGNLKVTDFGLAKRVGSQSLQMTQAGQILGTPYYMSPEQCESREVDFLTDVYSLGATYFCLLTGKSPYQDNDSVVQVMYSHCQAEIPDPAEINPTVPAACKQVITRAMAKAPADRYQSMNEFRRDLEAVLAAFSGANLQLPSQSSTDWTALPVPSQGASPAVGPLPQSSRPRKLLAYMAGLVLLGIVFLLGGLTFLGAPKGDRDRENITAVPSAGVPLRIGVLHSLTGTMAESESPVIDAIQLAIEEINQQGGVLGRPLQAMVADGRSDPETFSREARRLIEDEQVATLFGCWTSASRKMVVPVVEELNQLLIYSVQYEGLEESPNVFYLGATPNQQIIPAVRWAHEDLGKQRFFLVGSDYVFPRVAHAIIKDQLNQFGIQIVGEAFLPLGSMDVEDVIQQIVDSQPDVIVNCLNGNSNGAFFRQLRRAGIRSERIPTISFSIGEEEIRFINPEEMLGEFASWNYFQSIDSEENQVFVSSFQQKFGSHRLLNDPMESTYMGVKLWAQAVNAANSLEISDIRREMRNQRITAPGGELRIDAGSQHAYKIPRIGQLQANGQFQIVWAGDVPMAPQPYPATRSAEQWRAMLHDLYMGWGERWSAQ